MYTSYTHNITLCSYTVQKVGKNAIWVTKLKIQPKKDEFQVPPQPGPQGVDQLLHVDQLWGVDKIWKKNFHFQTFFVDFRHEITEKGKKMNKKAWKRLKKVVRPAFQCGQILKQINQYNCLTKLNFTFVARVASFFHFFRNLFHCNTSLH